MWPIEAVSFCRIATVEQTAGTDRHIHIHSQHYRIPRAATPRGIKRVPQIIPKVSTRTLIFT